MWKIHLGNIACIKTFQSKKSFSSGHLGLYHVSIKSWGNKLGALKKRCVFMCARMRECKWEGERTSMSLHLRKCEWEQEREVERKKRKWGGGEGAREGGRLIDFSL